ncbi:polycystic kidney disease and receptor for egg jelly-related protein [Elysia marginata]|uniref:Polycystic kidney disease and receptor for egg jelly-related protein n=1 Tax=Elysia marginata TaxID=1093978 RepID=A0AAV4FTI3_9GAST|nr:polycystic kidney disease and receptor for egg jelly-related protein [Elysia marginata]
MLNVSHVYSSLGTYTFFATCFNPMGNMSGTLDLEITSPAPHALANLTSAVIALNVDTNSAQAELNIDHMYLTGAYNDMDVEVDKGLGGPIDVSTMPAAGHKISVLYTEKGTYTLTVTFKAFGEEVVKTLSLRVGILEFHIEDKPVFAMLDAQQTMFAKSFIVLSGEADAIVNLGHETLRVSFAGNREMFFPATFTEVGEKRLTATMSYLNITEVCEYNVTVFRGCVSTPNLFQVEHRDPSTPMEVLISAVPSVSGRAVRTEECAETENFMYQWKLWRNSGTPPVYTWDKVNIEQPYANSLVLSKYVLEPGLYKAWLELAVTGTTEVVFDEIHIEAFLPSIVAAIAGGGSLQQVIIGDSYFMDAASASYDPASAELDQSSLGPSSLIFNWDCYQLDSEDSVARYTVQFNGDNSYRSLPMCSGVGALPEKGQVTLDTSIFSHGDLALFEVFVLSNIGDRNATAVTVLKMVSGERPAVALKCIWNCEAKLLPNQRAVFEAQVDCETCTEEERASWTYTWSLYKYNPSTKNNEEIPHASWDARITSEPTAQSFDTEGGWWEEDTSYTLKVEVRFSADQTSEASTSIFPDLPPYGGTCDVTPKSGRAVDTMFKFSFPGWKDEYDRPRRDVDQDSQPFLLYSVQQVSDVETPVIYKGGNKPLV